MLVPILLPNRPTLQLLCLKLARGFQGPSSKAAPTGLCTCSSTVSVFDGEATLPSGHHLLA